MVPACDDLDVIAEAQVVYRNSADALFAVAIGTVDLRLEVIADAHVAVAIDGVPVAGSRSRVRATGTVADAEIAEAHRRVVASSQAVEVLRAVGRRDELEAEAAARAGVARHAGGDRTARRDRQRR